MNLKITLVKDGDIRLPIHYNQLVQAAIYRSITPELATFLHDKGFTFEKRRFKMFTFSRLQGKAFFERQRGELVFPEGHLNLVVASPLDVFCQELGNIFLLSNQVQLADQVLQVTKVEAQKPEVRRETANFRLLSPVVVYSTLIKGDGSKYTCFFEPGEKEFAEQLDSNLRKKYYSLYREDPPERPVKVQPEGQVRRNIVRYKNFYIKGYSCRLKMDGPTELLQLALEAGIGSKNSQGFGCLQLIN